MSKTQPKSDPKAADADKGAAVQHENLQPDATAGGQATEDAGNDVNKGEGAAPDQTQGTRQEPGDRGENAQADPKGDPREGALTAAPIHGNVVHAAVIDSENSFSREFQWSGTDREHTMLRRGLIFREKEKADRLGEHLSRALER